MAKHCSNSKNLERGRREEAIKQEANKQAEDRAITEEWKEFKKRRYEEVKREILETKRQQHEKKNN